MSDDENLDPSSPVLKTPATILPYFIARRLSSLPHYGHVSVEYGDTSHNGESAEELAERVGKFTDHRLKVEIHRAGGPNAGTAQSTLGDT